MNVLTMNNFCYPRGGAENVFLAENGLLQKFGHKVTAFSCKHPQNLSTQFSHFFPSEVYTDSFRLSAKRFRSLLGLFYSLESKRCLKSLLDMIQVDVAHAHNIYARLTTSSLDVLRQKGIPVVMTLHDYKVICPNYKLMHHGKICEDCKGNGFYHAILNRCHKDSLIASAIYSLETYFTFIFNKYRKNISYFISPSRFLRQKLVEFGWPESRIAYIPNFLSVEYVEPNFTPGNYFLYLGRLSIEKGIETLIQAFLEVKHPGIQLKIAGEGPLAHLLKKKAAPDPRISFSGYLSGKPLSELTKNCLAVVVPSEWYENAPLSVLEAMAYGKPVIGARIGGIPEMIDDGRNGLLFEAGDAHALTGAMSTLLAMNERAIADMGRSARGKVENEYNAYLHYDKLVTLYRKAIHITPRV